MLHNFLDVVQRAKVTELKKSFASSASYVSFASTTCCQDMSPCWNGQWRSVQPNPLRHGTSFHPDGPVVMCTSPVTVDRRSFTGGKRGPPHATNKCFFAGSLSGLAFQCLHIICWRSCQILQVQPVGGAISKGREKHDSALSQSLSLCQSYCGPRPPTAQVVTMPTPHRSLCPSCMKHE